VIVDDLDVEGIPGLPSKADPVPIVDTDAVLTLSISTQRFEMIARRDSQILQRRCSVEDPQLPQGDPLQVRRH